MGSEADLTSDSDDGYITKIGGADLEHLKQILINCILESKNLTGEIHHLPGHPAKLFLTIGNKRNFEYPSTSSAKPSAKLLVKNLPDTADKDHLEMFFEHTKRQGGGPVKRVTLYKDDNLAIIEFQEANAVDKVLKKQPIKMLGTTAEVERYTPYLQDDERLKSIELRGIPKHLSKDIATMRLKKERGKSADHGTCKAQAVKVVKNRADSDSDDSNSDDDDPKTFGGSGRQYNMEKRHEKNPNQKHLRTPAKTYPSPRVRRTEQTSSQRQSTNEAHPWVVCDGCDKSIAGIRYKCRSCRDFDFCSSCKSRCAHNPTHKFEKIPHPVMNVTDPLIQALNHILK